MNMDSDTPNSSTTIIAPSEDGCPVSTSSPSSRAHVHTASGVSPLTTPRNSSSLEVVPVNLSTPGCSIPEPPSLRRKPSRFALLVQGLKNNGNETLVNEPRLKTSKSAVSLRSLFASQSTQRRPDGSSTSELQPPRQKLSSRLLHGLKVSGNGTDVNERRLRTSKSALSLRTLFTAQSTQKRRRGSHGGAIEIPQRDNDDYLSIKPYIPGVFTPNLPPELWSLIFQYSMNAPFPIPTSRSNSNLPHSPYPYSTVISPSHSTSQGDAEYPRPVSFLAQAPPHDHLSERLCEYTRLLHWKASLTRVCRLWNVVGQQPLYEFVWIAKAREGRALAERLGGDGMMTVPPLNIGCSVTVPRVNQKKAKRAMALSWIKSVLGSDSRVATPTALPTIKSPRPSRSSISSTRVNAGRHIRRLHIETPALDKCSPHDLLLILQHCPNLETFSDYRSVRRPMHPLALSLSPVVPFSHVSSSLSRIANNSHATPWSSHTLSGQAHPARQTLLTPDALLHTLLSRPLKKLSWTNYEYEGGANFSRGVRFYEEVVGPRLASVGANLEFLEIALSCGADTGMGRREVGGMWSVGGVGLCESSSGALMHEQEERWKQERMQEMMERRLDALLSGYEDAEGSIPQAPQRTAFEAGMLTRLEVTGATTTTYISPRDPLSTLTATSPTVGIDGFEYTLVLPALTSLKVVLDNATFFVLSSWDMPLLTHLSVMSADFAYAGGGFRKFFEVHGCKLFQLELGHSSGDIEEAWLTEAPGHWEGAAGSSSYRIPLEAWCPNLKQFICSADAEWDWQTPDWIAPHVLLPAHSGVEFIGVRDMERRLVGDAEQFARRIRGEGAATTSAQGGGGDADDPYFMLLEQFGSLLRPEAFPSLMVVRDMSWESSMVRKTGRLGLGSAGRALPSSSSRGLYPYESGSSEYPYMDSTVPRSRKLLSKASLSHLSSRRPQDSQSFSAGWKVQRFWDSIAEKCAARAVVLEDCHGEPIRGGGGHIAF